MTKFNKVSTTPCKKIDIQQISTKYNQTLSEGFPFFPSLLTA